MNHFLLKECGQCCFIRWTGLASISACVIRSGSGSLLASQSECGQQTPLSVVAAQGLADRRTAKTGAGLCGSGGVADPALLH